MICCDRCEEWYHGDCVGITKKRGSQMEENNEEYICSMCKGNAASPLSTSVSLFKGWMTRQFFWLIRISMSRNLTESSYSAIDTAEVPLNMC